MEKNRYQKVYGFGINDLHGKCSYIDKNGKRIHLGDFKTAKLAGEAYNNARIKQCEAVKEYMRELGIYSEEIINRVR